MQRISALFHTPHASILILAAYYLPAPLSLAELALKTQQAEIALLQAAQALQRKKWLHISDQHHLRLSEAVSDEILTVAAQTLSKTADTSILDYCLSKLGAQASIDDCEHVVRHIDKHLSKNNGPVLLCLDIVLHALLKWRHTRTVSVPSEHLQYIELVIVAQSMCLFLNQHLQTAVQLSSVAYSIATLSGNARIQPIVLILRCYLRLFIDDESSDISLFVDGLRELKNFDDKDMLELVPYFEGILHYVRGEFYKVLECYERCQEIEDWKYHRLADVLAFCTSQSALYQRKYAVALGISISGRTTASLAGDKYQALFWQLHVVFSLLRKGDFDAALENADALLMCASHRFNNKIAAGAVRAIALIHYLGGRLTSAYHLLRSETLLAISLGIPHSPFEDPLILDMLAAFEQAGWQPVPRYELDILLLRLGQSPDLQMRSAALRIQALRIAEAESTQAIKLLRRSVELAKSAQDKREIQLAMLALSDLLERIGENKEAGRLRKLVFALTGAVRLPNVPPYQQVLEATCGHAATPRFTENAALHCSIVKQCNAVMCEMPLEASLETMLDRFVKAVREVLDAERVLLVYSEASSLTCRAAVNFSQEERNSSAMRPLLQWIARCDAAWTLCNDGKGILFVLYAQKGLPWRLYIDNPHTSGAYLTFADAALSELGVLFAAEVRSILRLHEAKKRFERQQHHQMQAAALKDHRDMPPVIGTSMTTLLEQIQCVAVTDAPVLLLGETGVGKEVMARRVHQFSRCSGAFVAVHPASTPELLFESEFFGHERGAFTGATQQKIGLMEMADGGTLFIDEVGDIPFSIQTRLLRVLQEQMFRRIGGTRLIHSRFRLVTATNKDLHKAIQEGTFREDLLFRISVIPLTIPPLRQRKADIVPLASAFVSHFARRHAKPELEFTPAQRAALQQYAWPGNVRELKNMLERAVILGEFPELTLAENTTRALETLMADMPTLAQLEERYLRRILQQAGGKVRGSKGAASLLRLKISTLYAKLKKYNIPCGTIE